MMDEDERMTNISDDSMEVHVGYGRRSSLISLIYPLTVRVVGALQMISQPVSSILLID